MIVKATLLLEVEMDIDDAEATEETVRYLVEQDLEDNGWYVNSCELAESEEYVGAASKADATNELSEDLLNVFENIVGDIWTIVESTNGNYMVVSADVFDEQEADRMVIKLNSELKRLGLSKHVSSVKYYYAGSRYEERPLRVMMTLKKYVEL